MQHYYQFQVILKPSPADSQDLYLGSLAAIGLDRAKPWLFRKHDSHGEYPLPRISRGLPDDLDIAFPFAFFQPPSRSIRCVQSRGKRPIRRSSSASVSRTFP